jgi:Protein tyrosine and serine/threonine kinase
MYCQVGRELYLASVLPSRVTDAATGCSARVLSKSSFMICTPLQVTHMPPELMLQQKLTTAADVFSFGVLLWEVRAHQSIVSQKPV